MARNAGEKATKGDPDITGWYRMPEAAKKIGCSLSAITRMSDKGILTPHVVDAVNWYDPGEVDAVAAERQANRDKLSTPEGRREVLAEFQVTVVKDIIGLLKDPREKIDSILFDMISGLRVRVKELEAELDSSRKAVEEAKDQSLERSLAIKTVESEGRIKELAMSRMVETVGKLINGFGKTGVQFTPDQLQELLLANKDGDEPFLTAEQVKAAQAIVDQAAKTKANGKGAVASVAKAAKEVVEGTT